LPQLAFGGTLCLPGDPAERFGFNMKQISTGAGLLGLGVCILVASLFATSRAERVALAQNPEAAPTIVKQDVFPMSVSQFGNGTTTVVTLIAVRTYSDYSVSARVLGHPRLSSSGYSGALVDSWQSSVGGTSWEPWPWRTILQGGVAFSSFDEIMSAVNQSGDNPTDEFVDRSPR
jgi:hypothetical protein